LPRPTSIDVEVVRWSLGVEFPDDGSGVQQTNQGDLKMVTEWANLPFIIRNPYLGADELNTAPSDLSGGPRYVSIEPFRGS
jgi:hypothetical protein